MKKSKLKDQEIEKKWRELGQKRVKMDKISTEK